MTTREQVEKLAREAFAKVFDNLNEPDVFSTQYERELLNAVINHAVATVRKLTGGALSEEDAFRKVAETVPEHARDMAIQSIAIRRLPNTGFSLPLGVDIPEKERQAFENDHKALLDLTHSLHQQLEEERKRREEAERRVQYAAPTSLDIVTPVFGLGLTRDFGPEDVAKGRVEIWSYLSVKQPGSDVDVQLTLLGNLPEERLREINRDVQNNLTPYGLKTIYLVMRECHHNGLQSWFRLDTNRCLDALGYERRKNGTHRPKNRRRFLDELRFLSDTIEITLEKRFGGKLKDRGFKVEHPIFKLSGHWEEWETLKGHRLEEGEKIDEGYYVFVHPDIYKYVADGWYTWIPERFLAIDPHKHGHAILLIAYCENQWKIGWSEYQGVICQPLRQILTGSGLIYEYQKIKRSDHRTRFLERIREELDWMKAEGYVKDFDWLPKERENRASPLDYKVTIRIRDDHALIQEEKGNRMLPERGGLRPDEELTPDRIREIRRTYDLTQQQFAEELGVSRPTIAGVESGARPVSVKLRGLIGEFLYQKRAQ